MRFPARLEASGLSPESLLPLPEELQVDRLERYNFRAQNMPADGVLKAMGLFAIAPVAVLVPA